MARKFSRRKRAGFFSLNVLTSQITVQARMTTGIIVSICVPMKLKTRSRAVIKFSVVNLVPSVAVYAAGVSGDAANTFPSAEFQLTGMSPCNLST